MKFKEDPCPCGCGDVLIVTDEPTELETLRAERNRYRKALEKIAACESRVPGDVVYVAREALGGR